MRYSKLFAPTLREVPAEAEIASHQLMLRAGMMRKVASGVYTYLPLGWRTIEKISDIIRAEMNSAGGQELMFPIVQPAELWQKSGRWEVYGGELWRLKDRHDRDFCLGPTHEEIATSLILNDVNSYKQLPLLIYQIQNKYRDERRPRFGLMRGREFIMKDCYSFDRDAAALDVSYHLMYDAYVNIFNRCGLDFRPVKADNGAIGGSSSHEFMVLAESGEAEILYCDTCDYAANVEIADCAKEEITKETQLPLEKVLTPECRTIMDVAEFLHMDTVKTMKALFYMADEKPVLIFVRGDRLMNEVKVQNYLGATLFYMGTEDDLNNAGLVQGFIGPCGQKVRVLIDREVAASANLCCGANEEGYHLKNANFGRDFQGEVGDFRLVEAGERCPECGGVLQSARGIEVGQVFKLGTKYSVSMEASYLDENGKANPFEMGCYGIGVGRTMAAAIEQNHDENGIIWPKAIAPFQVILVPVSEKSARQMEAANDLYLGLQEKGVEVLLDDRAERAGVKFKDADLIGIPLRITIGDKSLDQGLLEYKERKSGVSGSIDAAEAVSGVLRLLDGIE
ncbi:MAG TPA: proline--tRNA ligase [Clostridiales bacterium]|nr:proline--tRNA ligase [Clostridiales bacterium]